VAGSANSQVKEAPGGALRSQRAAPDIVETKRYSARASDSGSVHRAGKVTAEQDQLDLVSARVEVEKARLEASNRKWSAGFKGRKQNRLSLAEEKLKVQERPSTSMKGSSAAENQLGKKVARQAQADIDLAIIAWTDEMKAP